LFPRIKKSSKQNVLRVGRSKENNDGDIKRHHFAWVSGLVQKAENTFRPVHSIKCTVLWRRFNL
jgi:hypothetical protein